MADRTTTTTKTTASQPTVRHLRQALLWPLRLMPVAHGQPARHGPWQLLRDMGDASPWRELIDEYTGDREDFHERHYNEFVSFLPYVQRFLYGEGRTPGKQGNAAESPMRVFRRRDIAALRVVPRPGDAPITLQVVHIDLYFFFDVDVVLLNVEVSADNLSLAQAQEQLYRFGRAYPAGWDVDGAALHCMASVEWLAADGSVLANSDAQQREAFISHVAEHRAPRIAAHWAYVMKPLVLDHSGEPGLLRYSQIEYYRMPVMAYLSLDEPRDLSRITLLLTILGESELTVEARSGKLAAEYASHRRDDHAHVLGGLPSLIPPDVSVPCILVPLTCRIDMRFAGRIVRFVERELSFRDRDEDGARVAVPSRRSPRSVVVLSHDDVERCVGLRLKIYRPLCRRLHFEGVIFSTCENGRRHPGGRRRHRDGTDGNKSNDQAHNRQTARDPAF